MKFVNSNEMITPSIYLQGVPQGDLRENPLLPPSKRFQDMYVVAQSEAFKTSLAEHDIQKLVASKEYIALLTDQGSLHALQYSALTPMKSSKNIKQYKAIVTTVSNNFIGDSIQDVTASPNEIIAVFKDIKQQTSLFKWRDEIDNASTEVLEHDTNDVALIASNGTSVLTMSRSGILHCLKDNSVNMIRTTDTVQQGVRWGLGSHAAAFNGTVQKRGEFFNVSSQPPRGTGEAPVSSWWANAMSEGDNAKIRKIENLKTRKTVTFADELMGPVHKKSHTADADTDIDRYRVTLKVKLARSLRIPAATISLDRIRVQLLKKIENRSKMLDEKELEESQISGSTGTTKREGGNTVQNRRKYEKRLAEGLLKDFKRYKQRRMYNVLYIHIETVAGRRERLSSQKIDPASPNDDVDSKFANVFYLLVAEAAKSPLKDEYFKMFDTNNLNLVLLIMLTEISALKDKLEKGSYSNIDYHEVKEITTNVLKPRVPEIAYLLLNQLKSFENLRVQQWSDFILENIKTLFVYTDTPKLKVDGSYALKNYTRFPNTFCVSVVKSLYSEEEQKTASVKKWNDATLKENIKYFESVFKKISRRFVEGKFVSITVDPQCAAGEFNVFSDAPETKKHFQKMFYDLVEGNRRDDSYLEVELKPYLYVPKTRGVLEAVFFTVMEGKQIVYRSGVRAISDVVRWNTGSERVDDEEGEGITMEVNRFSEVQLKVVVWGYVDPGINRLPYKSSNNVSPVIELGEMNISGKSLLEKEFPKMRQNTVDKLFDINSSRDIGSTGYIRVMVKATKLNQYLDHFFSQKVNTKKLQNRKQEIGASLGSNRIDRIIDSNNNIDNGKAFSLSRYINMKTNVISIDCGEWHIGTLTDSGDVYTWGTGAYGLGHPSVVSANTPVKVKLPHPAIQLVCGQRHTGVITTFGELYMFGDNSVGQIGSGDMDSTRLRPVKHTSTQDTEDYMVSSHRRRTRVILPTKIQLFNGSKKHLSVRQVSCGDYHTAALTTDGLVYTWGKISGRAVYIPRRLDQLLNHQATMIACGPDVTAVVLAGPGLYLNVFCADRSFQSGVTSPITTTDDGVASVNSGVSSIGGAWEQRVGAFIERLDPNTNTMVKVPYVDPSLQPARDAIEDEYLLSFPEPYEKLKFIKEKKYESLKDHPGLVDIIALQNEIVLLDTNLRKGIDQNSISKALLAAKSISRLKPKVSKIANAFRQESDARSDINGTSNTDENDETSGDAMRMLLNETGMRMKYALIKSNAKNTNILNKYIDTMSQKNTETIRNYYENATRKKIIDLAATRRRKRNLEKEQQRLQLIKEHELEDTFLYDEKPNISRSRRFDTSSYRGPSRAGDSASVGEAKTTPSKSSLLKTSKNNRTTIHSQQTESSTTDPDGLNFIGQSDTAAHMVENTRVPCKLATFGEQSMLLEATRITVAIPIDASVELGNHADVFGSFVLIRRGGTNISFTEKVRVAHKAGAKGIIFMDRAPLNRLTSNHCVQITGSCPIKGAECMQIVSVSYDSGISILRQIEVCNRVGSAMGVVQYLANARDEDAIPPPFHKSDTTDNNNI